MACLIVNTLYLVYICPMHDAMLTLSISGALMICMWNSQYALSWLILVSGYTWSGIESYTLIFSGEIIIVHVYKGLPIHCRTMFNMLSKHICQCEYLAGGYVIFQ